MADVSLTDVRERVDAAEWPTTGGRPESAQNAPPGADTFAREASSAPIATATPASVAVPVPVRIEPYQLPTESLQSLAAEVGLEWVNSDAEKIRAVQQAMASEPAPVRVPREPVRHVLADEGPLVLVETRKDLSQLRLPFETASAPASGAVLPQQPQA